MRLVRIFILIFILSVFCCGICYSGTEEDFPKIGFVKNDSANVRAGDNVNFESLCELEKNDPVKIMDKHYSWFKIMLPKKAHLYIKDDYVDLTSKKGIGVVNAMHVNLRVRPGTKYSILGQVSKPEKLNVIAEKDGWYEILPPEGTMGWVHSGQISFTLNNIERAEIKKEEKEETKVVQKQEKSPVSIPKTGKQSETLTLKSSKSKGNLRFSTEND